jgi:protein tyrosine/serine phosphatase
MKRVVLSIEKLLLGVAALTVSYGIYYGYLLATDNFHVVVAGEVYRAAQPTGAEITKYQKEYGIRAIINLRGSNAGKAWYKQEVAVSQELGIAHIDFGMSSSQLQSPEKLQQLITVLATAPKPLLIHCNWGADRTGLASAIYLAAIAKQPELAAEGQLSVRFGHFPLPYISRAYPMDQSFEGVEKQFGYKGTVWDYVLPPVKPKHLAS